MRASPIREPRMRAGPSPSSPARRKGALPGGLLLAAALVLGAPTAGAEEPPAVPGERASEEASEAGEAAREAAKERRERAEERREQAEQRREEARERSEEAGEEGGPPGEPVFGRELMTSEEIAEHRRTMRSLSGEEREAYRREHHERMRKRAEERGLELPEEPLGPGGPGPGRGRGRGMGSGMGPGRVPDGSRGAGRGP